MPFDKIRLQKCLDIPKTVAVENYLTPEFVETQRKKGCTNCIPRAVFGTYVYYALPENFTRNDAMEACRRFFGDMFNFADIEEIRHGQRWRHEFDYAMELLKYLGIIVKGHGRGRWQFSDRRSDIPCDEVFGALRKANSKAAQISNRRAWKDMSQEEVVAAFCEFCNY